MSVDALRWYFFLVSSETLERLDDPDVGALAGTDGEPTACALGGFSNDAGSSTYATDAFFQLRTMQGKRRMLTILYANQLINKTGIR